MTKILLGINAMELAKRMIENLMIVDYQDLAPAHANCVRVRLNPEVSSTQLEYAVIKGFYGDQYKDIAIRDDNEIEYGRISWQTH